MWYVALTHKVLVTTIDALGHFLNRMITAQWESMGDVGSAVGEVRAGTTSPMPDHMFFLVFFLFVFFFLSEFSEI